MCHLWAARNTRDRTEVYRLPQYCPDYPPRGPILRTILSLFHLVFCAFCPSFCRAGRFIGQGRPLLATSRIFRRCLTDLGLNVTRCNSVQGQVNVNMVRLFFRLN